MLGPSISHPVFSMRSAEISDLFKVLCPARNNVLMPRFNGIHDVLEDVRRNLRVVVAKECSPALCNPNLSRVLFRLTL